MYTVLLGKPQLVGAVQESRTLLVRLTALRENWAKVMSAPK